MTSKNKNVKMCYLNDEELLYKFIVSTRSSISGTEVNVICDVELNSWSLRF